MLPLPLTFHISFSVWTKWEEKKRCVRYFHGNVKQWKSVVLPKRERESWVSFFLFVSIYIPYRFTFNRNMNVWQQSIALNAMHNQGVFGWSAIHQRKHEPFPHSRHSNLDLFFVVFKLMMQFEMNLVSSDDNDFASSFFTLPHSQINENIDHQNWTNFNCIINKNSYTHTTKRTVHTRARALYKGRGSSHALATVYRFGNEIETEKLKLKTMRKQRRNKLKTMRTESETKNSYKCARSK